MLASGPSQRINPQIRCALAPMVGMVDTGDLKSSAERRTGSSPVGGT